MAKFTYWIDHNERGEFRASVQNEVEETVYTIYDYQIFEDGFMKHDRDLKGLQEYLTDLDIMTPADRLIYER